MSETSANSIRRSLHKCLMVICSICAWSSFGMLVFFIILLGWSTRPFVHDPQKRCILFRNRLHRTAFVPLLFLRGVHVHIENACKEDFRKQAIIICNHQSILDLLVIISTIPNLSILMKEEFRTQWLFRQLARMAGYHFASNDYVRLFHAIESDVQAGSHLLIFPEGTRSQDGHIGPFHNGAFSMARYFRLDILPLHISGMYEVLPKGRFVAESHTIRLQVLPRITSNQPLFRANTRTLTKRVENMYHKLHSERPTVCVIGGGMGGLFAGAILAETGYQVTVLEKNHIIGGGLQSFRRGEAVFNTGMHNFGGFGEEWALSHLLHYLHIKQELAVMPVDKEAQEILYTSPERCYRLPQGRDAFEKYLSSLFPDQAQGLHAYIETLYQIAYSFDHYMMRRPLPHPEVKDYMQLSVNELIRLYITDEELIRVLSYITPMCGHSISDIPVSVYSMLSVLYLSGEYRFIDNSLQLAEALAASIQANGGCVLADTEVCKLDVEGMRVHSVTSIDGRPFYADQFVAAIPPKTLFSLTDAPIMRKVSRRRAETFSTEISAMSLFIELKEESFPFINSTILLPTTHQDPKMPNYILMTTPPSEQQGRWAHTIEILSPIYNKVFAPWEDTKLMHRGADYEQLKQQIAQETINHVCLYYPSLLTAIRRLYVGSPLTIRDYYNNPGGALFAQQGLYMPLRTHTENLFITGQSVLFHGLCGVPLTAILTAETLSGKDILTDIRNATHD